jgi:DNA helicase II / ATP-dependent DNA helicase PcrA
VDAILKGLNPSQCEAVQHVDGPLLILAGPGSGKTRVVTHRIAWMIEQGVTGGEILALTFTNKAADEMRQRVERLAPHQHVRLGTFHGFSARLIREFAEMVGLEKNYTIFDADDSRRAMQRTIDRLKIDMMHHNAGQVASAVSWAKGRLIGPDNYVPKSANALGMLVEKIYPYYQEDLRRMNSVDFDDLLFYTATLLRDNPEVRKRLDSRYRYILVDEYQDTNLAQYAIARGLSITHPNLAVTGDPDQSIYGWRGANIQNILDFENDFPDVKVIRLEQNYRSTQHIVRVASRLIRHNIKRKAKDIVTENPAGKPVRIVDYRTNAEESRDIAKRIHDAVASGERRFNDFAVFYRTNALSRTYEFAFREFGIPFQLIHALEFYQRKEVKDLRSYLQLIQNPRDDMAMTRILNVPRRGIGRTTLDRLNGVAAQHGVSLLESARNAKNIDSLAARAKKLVRGFVELFGRLEGSAHRPVEEILGLILSETGYDKGLEESGTEEDLDRLANIQELLTVARQFDERYVGASALEGFLEETALAADTDDWESESDAVTLMTLHGSKGLEFPVVFVTAVEEGLLPHERSQSDADQVEEERRLFFVGITRAQEELQISKAVYRDFRGQRRLTIPSRFLTELPRDEMEMISDTPGFTSTIGSIDADATFRGYATPYGRTPINGGVGIKSSDAFSDFRAFDDSRSDRSSKKSRKLRNTEQVDEYAQEEIDDEAYLELDSGSDLKPEEPNSVFGENEAFDDSPIEPTEQEPLHEEEHVDEPPPKKKRKRRPQLPLAASLMTAASLAGEEPDDVPPVDVFKRDTVVSHPEFGVGKILALGGSGEERTAEIDFAATVGRTTVRLSEGRLKRLTK